LRDRLSRNGVPFEFYPADSAEGQQLIRGHGIDVRRLPAVIHHSGQVQHDPSFAEVAQAHGIHTRPAPETHDLAVVGAGPAGLSAAVFGASEGLRTVVLEAHAIGAQAAARAMIIAAGVAYRRLPIPALERLIGAGVFYGAAGVEAPAMAGEHVFVVGGANSAGQAALHPWPGMRPRCACSCAASPWPACRPT
jgi:hypothetical protein